MESIVLAISGLSLLGVSAVLSRAAEKQIANMRKNQYIQLEPVRTNSEFRSALEARPILPPQLPVLLSRDASAVLESVSE